MKVKELIEILDANKDKSVVIELPYGVIRRNIIPVHYHITEVGRIDKKFIDCGGTERSLTYCMLQIWLANDVDHRLNSTKLLSIFNLAKSKLDIENLDVEFEYELGSITNYILKEIRIDKDLTFVLGIKRTDCLAPDKCGCS